jgi:8-oxo-dGTP pyrophosphatase MutT (NUDIX family)
VGGHIELNEDIEQALFREAYEETGLKKNQINVYAHKPKFTDPRTKSLLTPISADIHYTTKTIDISDLRILLNRIQKR